MVSPASPGRPGSHTPTPYRYPAPCPAATIAQCPLPYPSHPDGNRGTRESTTPRHCSLPSNPACSSPAGQATSISDLSHARPFACRLGGTSDGGPETVCRAGGLSNPQRIEQPPIHVTAEKFLSWSLLFYGNVIDSKSHASPYSNGIRCESIPSCIEGRIQRGVALVLYEHPKGVGKLHPRSNQKVESK